MSSQTALEKTKNPSNLMPVRAWRRWAQPPSTSVLWNQLIFTPTRPPWRSIYPRRSIWVRDGEELATMGSQVELNEMVHKIGGTIPRANPRLLPYIALLASRS
jgi:hypothetical protein